MTLQFTSSGTPPDPNTPSWNTHAWEAHHRNGLASHAFDALSHHIALGCPCLHGVELGDCNACTILEVACCKGRLHSAMLYFIELFEQSTHASNTRKLEYILNRTANIERQRDVAAAFRYLFHKIHTLH